MNLIFICILQETSDAKKKMLGIIKTLLIATLLFFLFYIVNQEFLDSNSCFEEEITLKKL